MHSRQRQSRLVAWLAMLAIWLTILAPVVSRTLPAEVMHAAMMGIPMDAAPSATAMAGMAMPSAATPTDTRPAPAVTPPHADAAMTAGSDGMAMEGMPSMATDAAMPMHHGQPSHHAHHASQAQHGAAPMPPGAAPAAHHHAGGEPLDDCGYCSLLTHSPSLLLDFFIASLLLAPRFPPPPVAVAQALPYTPTPVPPARGPPMPSHASSLA